MSSTVSRGIWSNLSTRSPSLTIKNPNLRNAVLSPNLPKGPVTLKALSHKRRYVSPQGLDQIYPLAYQILEAKSEEVYGKVKEVEESIKNESDSSKLNELKRLKEELLVTAEAENPEVVYNSLFALNSVDRTQPVYRRYLQKNWKSYKRMLTMQRLETLAIIPDTLPTLDPQVDVKMKFPHNNVDTWIEPGVVLSSAVTSKPPVFEIVEFKESIDDLYSVLIVNPDTPDVENDTFTTTLHYALKNVKLSNTDYMIDIKKLDQNPDYIMCEYMPPVPEKNLGKQRFAVWVFRQSKKLDQNLVNLTRENFDIRKFVSEHELNPVGAHVWRSVWDLNVDNVRKMYGLPKGRIFSRERI